MNDTLVPVGGRPAWLGSTLDYREDGLWQLSVAELAEIDAALTTLKGHGDLDLIAITPETFPLPTVGRFVSRLRDELWSGRGFVLIRGLSRDRYGDDDLARIYCGRGPRPHGRDGPRAGSSAVRRDAGDARAQGCRAW